jgi:integrase
MEAFEMIKTITEITTNDARKLVQDCFAQAIANQETQGAFAPKTAEPDMEFLEQRVLSEDRITELRNQIETNQFDNSVRQRVRDITTLHGFGPNELTEARLTDIANGVARTFIEQQRLFLVRLEDRLAPFEPADSLFQDRNVRLSSEATPYNYTGPSLGDAVQRYLETYRTIWKLKTYKARVWQLGYLVQYIGTERPLASIKPNDIRSYRDAVLTLRANHGFQPSQSFSAKRTANPKARIQKQTASLIFKPIKAFLNWAVSTEGLIERNPAQDIKIVSVKDKLSEPVRRPFEAHEIKQLFSSPTFTGCKSKHRRYVAGEQVHKDGKYWLPILGYLTGCRLGELVQLAIEDVREEGSIVFLDINEKALAGNNKKSVKSQAGCRKVPLHPDLIKIGFMDFVSKRAKQDKPSARLFSEIRFGNDGQASTEYSKIFGRLMNKVGLTDAKLVFHSWRHGAEDALRDAGCQPYVIDRIIGHADTTMGGKYGNGVSLDVLAKAVAEMKLPVSVLKVLEKK